MSEMRNPIAGLPQDMETVVVFVRDSLRWDYHPQSVRARGVTFKTVASSLFTAAFFLSIVSGLYSYRHDVFSFRSSIDPIIPAITNIREATFSLWTETAWTIFTSDHGELLGEYGGLVGHSCFACPKLVFVPTAFTHPSLLAGVSITGKIIRHTDLFHIILSALGLELPSALDGVDLMVVRHTQTTASTTVVERNRRRA